MRDEITPHTTNKTLTTIEVQSGRYMRHPETWEMPLTLPLKVSSIETYGKLLIWNLENNNYIFCRAAMSGRWTLREEKHNHIKFSFSDNTHIYFNDARNFGSIKFGNQIDKSNILAELGIDPLREPVTYEKIKHRVKTNDQIGKTLLDQSVVAGSGNYLRAEVLYAVQINPLRKCKDLTVEEWNRICDKMTEITNLSYKNGGATIRSYKNLTGERGKFSERFHCYGRKTDPEGRTVVREVDDSKRAIWWVPEVQK